MKSRTMKYYNWSEDLQPVILANLNELLAAEGTAPLRQLHGGTFKDGKWVSVMDSKDYRNYWHAYLDLFDEEGVRNDNFQDVYFSHHDNHEAWDELYQLAEKFGDVKRSNYTHSDPKWACNLVTAVRKMLKDNDIVNDIDGSAVTIWWSW